jgi:hypothetical protein
MYDSKNWWEELIGDKQETPPAQYVFKTFVALCSEGQQIIKYFNLNTIQVIV